MTVFIEFEFCENDFLSGVETDGRKRKHFFLGCGCESFWLRVFLLQARDWLKCWEDFDLPVDDFGKSITVPDQEDQKFHRIC